MPKDPRDGEGKGEGTEGRAEKPVCR